MRILITRPREDAERVAEMLRARGHEPIVSPLMEIHFFDGPEIDLDGVQAILATSANGIRALARRTSRRDLPVFAVGPQTASVALEKGFHEIRNAHGDALALADATQRWAHPNRQILLHATGCERSRNLGGILSGRGFIVRIETLYETLAAESLPAEAMEGMRSGAIDAAMLFSPRSARILGECLDRANLVPCCRSLTAICISQHTANRARALPFAQIRIAAQPNIEALLALLN